MGVIQEERTKNFERIKGCVPNMISSCTSLKHAGTQSNVKVREASNKQEMELNFTKIWEIIETVKYMIIEKE